MLVEIFSDIQCPFCYIGKRHFEAALAQFPGKNEVQVTWKSYQLDPSIPLNREEKQGVHAYLAERKGISLEQSEELHQNVTDMAARAGLTYRFDRAIVSNSLPAHRIIQLAKEKGLGDEAEERFFSAYFTEGKDLNEEQTLTDLGKEIGLNGEEVRDALTNERYAALVQADLGEAREIGVSGVPFFVFDRKYAVSGAQPAEQFLKVMTTLAEEQAD